MIMKKSLMMLAVAAMMVACGDAAKKSAEEQKAAAEKKAQEAVDVKVAPAEVKTIDVAETYTAELLPFMENDITPAAAGLHIKQILVDVGDKVRSAKDGMVYVCYANGADPLTYDPADAVSIFELA